MQRLAVPRGSRLAVSEAVQFVTRDEKPQNGIITGLDRAGCISNPVTGSNFRCVQLERLALTIGQCHAGARALDP